MMITPAADMAQRIGKEEMPLILPERADFYKNLFDTETQIHHRNADGSWKSPSTLVRLPTWKVPVETIPKVIHGSTLGMCNMMCRGLLSYSAENRHSLNK